MDDQNKNKTRIEEDLRQLTKHYFDKDKAEKKAVNTLNAVLDSIDHEIIITDVHQKIIYLNRKSHNNLFNKFSKLVGNIYLKDLFEQFKNNNEITDWEEVEKLYDRTNGKDNFVASTAKIGVTSTIEKYYEVFTSPVYDEDLGMLGRIWQFRDITMSERIDNMKSEFLSIAAHQLRTPTTSIKGYMDMLIKSDFGEVPDHLLQPLNAVMEATEQMSELVEDLLDISRIESGKYLKVEWVEINLPTFMEQIELEVRPLLSAKNQELKLNFKFPIKYSLQTDQPRLRESILNLINNASKYSEPNTEIVVSANYDDEKKHFVISVTDQGVGIPFDQQDQIFRKFFRAENVLNSSVDGTGLGLYYVKTAMEDLGGSVDFKSEPGVGSTFYLYLPQNLNENQKKEISEKQPNSELIA